MGADSSDTDMHEGSGLGADNTTTTEYAPETTTVEDYTGDIEVVDENEEILVTSPPPVNDRKNEGLHAVMVSIAREKASEETEGEVEISFRLVDVTDTTIALMACGFLAFVSSLIYILVTWFQDYVLTMRRLHLVLYGVATQGKAENLYRLFDDSGINQILLHYVDSPPAGIPRVTKRAIVSRLLQKAFCRCSSEQSRQQNQELLTLALRAKGMRGARAEPASGSVLNEHSVLFESSE